MFEDLPVAAIAAVADNGVIGVDGDLPWHLPDDLRWFKRVTSGHAVIMGRKTWQSLARPLPRRLNVVLSQHPAQLGLSATPRAPDGPTRGAQVCGVTTLTAALAHAAAWERAALADGSIAAAEIMIVGGAGVYAHAWPWVDRFYRTRVHLRPAGDTLFPPVSMARFELVSTQKGSSEPAHVFEIWQRR